MALGLRALPAGSPGSRPVGLTQGTLVPRGSDVHSELGGRCHEDAMGQLWSLACACLTRRATCVVCINHDSYFPVL